MRKSEISRKTAETDIRLSLCLDAYEPSVIQTGCGFLDHMLTLFARHGRFALQIDCQGDTYVDDHHTVEDVGIVLGQAFRQALGQMRGINRYGSVVLPMDEALVLCAIDLSGRSFLNYGLQVPAAKVGSFDTELAQEFFEAFVRNCPMSLHFKQLDGKNSHHILEAAFKAFAQTLRQAVALDAACPDEIPSTKGVL